MARGLFRHPPQPQRTVNQKRKPPNGPYTMPAANNGYEEAIFADTPVAVWTHGESSGSLIDLITGKVATDNGNVASHYGLSGAIHQVSSTFTDVPSGERFSTPDHDDLDLGNGTFSLETWVNSTTFSSGALLSKGTGAYQLNVVGGPNIELRHQGTGAALVTTDSPITLGDRWYHIVATWDGTSNSKIYVNGVARTATFTARSLNDNSSALTIQDTFDGRMQYTAIYKDVLSAARVLAHFDAAPPLTVGRQHHDIENVGWRPSKRIAPQARRVTLEPPVPATLLFNCGWECGVDQQGIGDSASRHWNTVSFTGGVLPMETSSPITGNISFHATADAVNACYAQSTIVSGKNIGIARATFKVNTVPTTATNLIGFQAGTNGGISVSGGGVLRARISGSFQAGPTLNVGDLYEVEVLYDVSSNDLRVDWRTRLNGGSWTEQTPLTVSGTATTFTAIQVGITNAPGTGDFFFDDFAVWGDSRLGYPHGSLEVIGHSPNADVVGGHGHTAGVMGYTDGTDVPVNATDVYTYLDEKPITSTSDYIQQKVAESVGFVSVSFEDSANGDPLGVEVVASMHSLGTGANTSSLRINENGGGTSTSIYTNLDTSDTSIRWASKQVATRPNGQPWTEAAFNTIHAEWGFATDVVDVPVLDGLMLEALFVASGVSTVSGSFTADAVVKREQSASFTADAVLKREYSATFTADACITTAPQQVPSRRNISALGWRPAKRIAPERQRRLAPTSLVAEQSRSFTADAIVLRTYSVTLAADAVLQRTYSAAFTADAVLVTTTSASFTADAVLLRIQGATFTGDAVVKREQSASFTADASITTPPPPSRADIRKSGIWRASERIAPQRWRPLSPTQLAATQSASFNADAVILRTQSASFTADAVLLRTQSATLTADAVVKREQSASFTADASITTPPPPSRADVRRTGIWRPAKRIAPQRWRPLAPTQLAVEQSASFTADACITAVRIRLASRDIYATGWRSAKRIAPQTRRVVRTPSYETGSFTADAIFLRTYSASFSADAVIARTTQADFSSDAVIFRTQAADFSADAVIVTRPYTRAWNITATGVFRPARRGRPQTSRQLALRTQEYEASFSADAVIQRTYEASFTADAYIQQTGIFGITADSVLQRTYPSTFTADAVIQRTTSAGLTADAAIQATIAASFTADAILKKERVSSFTADAVVKREISATLSADAVVLKTTTSSFSADALILKTRSASITADAVLQASRTGGFSADAVFLSLRTASYSADAVIRRTTSASFSADAYILAAGATQFTADAVLRRTQSNSFTADALLQIVVEGQLDVAAILLRTHSDVLSADAVLQRSRSASFTADGIVLRTFAQAFTADAVLIRSQTFTADAYLVRNFHPPIEQTLSVAEISQCSLGWTEISQTLTARALCQTFSVRSISQTLTVEEVTGSLDPSP